MTYAWRATWYKQTHKVRHPVPTSCAGFSSWGSACRAIRHAHDFYAYVVTYRMLMAYDTL
ncbi:hypothetical protein GLW00_19805 [Halobacillus litoralis]|uniref:Uncharacterized protein n=1 Tax=Halobacillus litoralis TaxID=45668 RepID=A0A845FH14_9BACI|nr:hypothetical protein [Halobacillus litoralis]MYL73064.1 hypothetical protein [Halobacillus litoralis]